MSQNINRFSVPLWVLATGAFAMFAGVEVLLILVLRKNVALLLRGGYPMFLYLCIPGISSLFGIINIINLKKFHPEISDSTKHMLVGLFLNDIIWSYAVLGIILSKLDR